MKTTTISALLALAAFTACDDRKSKDVDSGMDNPMVDAAPPKTFKQIEHLARPGIAEALLITNAFLAGYNATAPTFAGVPAATLDMVVAEAKTVLKALYLGACLLNGVTTPPAGLEPAGLTCHATGGALFTENNAVTGVTLTQASQTAAQAYADAVFNGFIPDVMRVDLSVTTSTYENLCGGTGTGVPFLCGGRFLDDDTIDTTYDFLLNGAQTLQGAAATNITGALVSDGVQFAETGNKNNRTQPDPSNPAQFHPAVNPAFPYSANPL